MFKPNVPLGLPWRQPANALVKAATQLPSPPEIVLPKDTETTEAMAHTLEAHPNNRTAWKRIRFSTSSSVSRMIVR